MKYFLLLNLFFLTAATTNFAQSVDSSIQIPLLANEQWWGGAVQYGYRMPFNTASSYSFNLYGDVSNNQSSPLLISDKGRWVWCDEPFLFTFKNGILNVTSHGGKQVQYGTAGSSLASAYQYASSHFFPTSGKWPDSLLVKSPQYNLWIELQYNPNQKDVSKICG